jgi:CheY-like chemotaxis protein
MNEANEVFDTLWVLEPALANLLQAHWHALGHLKDSVKDWLTVYLSRFSDSSSDAFAESITEEALVQAKYLIASYPHVPSTILDYFVEQGMPHTEVLIRVAENQNATAQTLSRLAEHGSSEVRCAVTDNENTPLGILESLAGDENPDVRYRIAENPHVHESVLKKLCEDENPYVSNRAKRTVFECLIGAKQIVEAAKAASEVAFEPSVKNEGKAAEPVSPLINKVVPSSGAGQPMAQLAQTGAEDRTPTVSTLTCESVRQISRQLRTLATTVLGTEQMLLSTELTAGQKELVKMVNDAGKTLLGFAVDLEDISRIERAPGPVENIPFNVIFVAQDSARSLAELAKEKGLALYTRIDQRIPEFLSGNPEQLRGILHSLIRLAIRSTDRGQISMEACVESEESDQVVLRFSVSDAAISREPTEEQIESVHITVMANKQLVESMDGDLELRRTPDGKTVSFTLPFKRFSTAKPADSAKLPAEVMPCNPLVLLVEDDTNLRWLTTKQLARMGLQCHIAATGQQAVEAVTTHNYNLILMDCYLPELDGFEASKAIRSQERPVGRHTPIIAMTAAAMPGDAERCLAAGMDDYLSKPVTQDQLQRKLEEWLPLMARKGLERTPQ